MNLPSSDKTCCGNLSACVYEPKLLIFTCCIKNCTKTEVLGRRRQRIETNSFFEWLVERHCRGINTLIFHVWAQPLFNRINRVCKNIDKGTVQNNQVAFSLPVRPNNTFNLCIYGVLVRSSRSQFPTSSRNTKRNTKWLKQLLGACTVRLMGKIHNVALCLYYLES